MTREIRARPAQSRANCHATRPLREPRCSAHWSAAWRTAPRFVKTYAGDYDHLARVREWSAGDEEDGERVTVREAAD